MTINNAVSERPILFSGLMIRAILEGRKTQTRRAITKMRGCSEWIVGDRILDTQAMLTHAQSTNAALRCDDLCPLGQPGERLWVREAWRIASLPVDDCPAIQYRADNSIEWRDPLDPIFNWDAKYEDWFERMNLQLIEDCERAGLEVNINEDMAYTWDWDSIPTRWRPSIHMPRWASRITLELTGIRVERIRDITKKDAIEEGIQWSEAFPEGYTVGASLDPSGMMVGGNYKFNAYSAEQCFAKLWNSINAKRSYGWDENPWVWVVEFQVLQPTLNGPVDCTEQS